MAFIGYREMFHFLCLCSSNCAVDELQLACKIMDHIPQLVMLEDGPTGLGCSAPVSIQNCTGKPGLAFGASLQV